MEPLIKQLEQVLSVSKLPGWFWGLGGDRWRRARALARAAARHNPPARAAASTQTADARHPCFGKLLGDLGGKRLYLASARTLVNTVPIWAKQRPCSEARVFSVAPHSKVSRSKADA